ncbi:TlpA family protein disulfide reductase [Agriterribacter sp.]|uniref:TlpA family protein disulfide reductase n=1 Tax=Agriterribacter sp. TaxID=2821509 RepID=UPI002B818C96|nr:TlpA family protein disulfide reductase [Agriterribacter sp.]HRP54992.1 TlpA family protein disulfide reductase [Agriterribacter sp.]
MPDPRVIITGKITGTIPDRIEYTLPVNGITYFGFENSVQPDTLGNFKIFLSIEKACFIELSNGYDAYGTVIAEPGMNYTLNINTENKKKGFVIACKSKEGQQLYNQNINRSMITGNFEEAAAEYRNDSNPDRIKESIKKRHETEIAKYRKLLSAGVISEDFYNLVSADRSYFYAGAQSSVALLNHLLSERNLNTLDVQAYSILWGEVFEDYPVSDPGLMRSPWFFYFTQSYLRYKALIENGINFNTLSEIRKQGLIHTHNINIARKYLSGTQLEYYYAAYLYYEAANKNYEKELIELFEDFKDHYALSEYTHFVESEIIPIITFHKKQNEAPNERIHVLDSFESISSLKEAAKKLDAERVYVDVWATWCGPCKKEFTHNSALYELLKKEGIAMLYVSVDKDEKHGKWMEMMKYYQLEGYHVRAGSKLIDDLQRLRGGDAFTIPWHILTDGDGNVLMKYAGAPSAIQTLEKQLSESRHVPDGNTYAE